MNIRTHRVEYETHIHNHPLMDIQRMNYRVITRVKKQIPRKEESLLYSFFFEKDVGVPYVGIKKASGNPEALY